MAKEARSIERAVDGVCEELEFFLLETRHQAVRLLSNLADLAWKINDLITPELVERIKAEIRKS
jgi:hypothetical protein